MGRTFLHGAWVQRCAAAMAALVLAGCGGGGGGGNTEPPPPPPTRYELSVSVAGSGSVSSSPAGINCGATCTASYDSGTEVTLSAAPAAGQVFSGWSGACTGTAACVVSMSAARSVTATFAAAPPTSQPLTVTVSGNGAVRSQPAGIDCGSSCNAQFATDSTVTLEPTPAAGQVFSAWSGACSGATPTCSVVMSQARSVTATFIAAAPTTFSLDLALSGSGRVTSQPAGVDCGTACAASFAADTTVTLTAAPNAGQTFTGWGGACTGSANTCSVSMTQNRSVTAGFAPLPAAPVWGTAQLMENSDDFNVTTSGLVYQLNAISSNGTAMVIWQQPDGQPDGGVSKVYSRMYLPGQGWMPAVQVPNMSDFSGRQLVAGKLFISPQGVVTWIRFQMDARRYTVDGGWTGPILPANKPTGSGSLSSAVMDEAGNIGTVTVGDDVYNITLGADGRWREWARVDASGALQTDAADVARSADGSAMAIWVERNPGDANDSMKAARYTAATGWQAPVTIDASFNDVDQNDPPRVVMDAAGNAIAAWRQSNAVQVATFSPGTGWSAPVAYDQGALSTAVPLRLRLAMAASGRAVLAWQSGIFEIKTMAFTPGSGFSAPVVATPYALDRELGIDEEGNAVLVYVAVDQWPNPTSPEISVYARRLPWGQTWGPQALLETQRGGIKSGLAASFNPSGRAVVSWAQNDAADSTVRNSLWSNLLR